MTKSKKPESLEDPGRLTSSSVAFSAFAAQESHGRVGTHIHMAMTSNP